MANILLAEDDHATRNFVCKALESDGHTVTAVLDGRDALQCLTSGHDQFDLLLADINMPVVTGIEVVEQISAEMPNLPILLMTGEASSISNQVSIIEKISSVVMKPFTLEKIRDEVRAALK